MTFSIGIPFLNTVPHKIHILVSFRFFGGNSKQNSCPEMFLKLIQFRSFQPMRKIQKFFLTLTSFQYRMMSY